LPGLVAARLGENRASNVILTDLPSELELLEKNVEANVTHEEDARVSVRACAWGELDDWRGEVFDTVLCSDVLYHQPRDVLEALANTLEALCSTEDGVVVFAYHFRENLVHDAQFFEFIDARFDERARVDFGDVWMFEWVRKRGRMC
jgi:predicted nicotinamide N-methyase